MKPGRSLLHGVEASVPLEDVSVNPDATLHMLEVRLLTLDTLDTLQPSMAGEPAMPGANHKGFLPLAQLLLAKQRISKWLSQSEQVRE